MVLAALSGSTYPSAAAGTNAIRGTYVGGGRACAGTLKIAARRIVWDTPFARCASRTFDVTTARGRDGQVEAEIVLHAPGPRCRDRFLRLTHDGGGDPATGWEVTAYPTREALKAAGSDFGLSCPLTR